MAPSLSFDGTISRLGASSTEWAKCMHVWSEPQSPYLIPTCSSQHSSVCLPTCPHAAHNPSAMIGGHVVLPCTSPHAVDNRWSQNVHVVSVGLEGAVPMGTLAPEGASTTGNAFRALPHPPLPHPLPLLPPLHQVSNNALMYSKLSRVPSPIDSTIKA